MRLLVLGGTVFLSRQVATAALERGHEVVCACRGASGTVPDGATHRPFDREGAVPTALAAEPFDAVVDVAGRPSWVARAVAAWPGARWAFVSTVSVYADVATPGGGPAVTALLPPQEQDADRTAAPDAYGPMKVACERVVQQGTSGAWVVRPGLVVGPGDPSGRFTYWPVRLAAAQDGEAVLAGGEPGDLVQVVDVRDLADWLVRGLEEGVSGVHDAVGPTVPVATLLDAVADGVGARPRFVWVDRAGLEAAGVVPWAGSRSLPLWLPRPDYDGMLSHDPAPARDAGLRCRPLAETAADTLAWVRAEAGAALTGLTRAEEADVLRSAP